jgi:beta-glucosidase
MKSAIFIIAAMLIAETLPATLSRDSTATATSRELVPSFFGLEENIPLLNILATCLSRIPYLGRFFMKERIKPHLNPELSVEERAEDLIKRMTLEEKVGQLWQVNPDDIRSEGKFDGEKARKVIVDLGAGSFLSIAGEELYALQRIAVEETRLGIPIIFGIDAIHGHALYPGATVFPMPLALSCSWNETLLEEIGKTTAREVEATGPRWTFAPIMDVARDPRWGRIVEGFGEDPYLVSVLGTAEIRGFQTKILACAKHFAAYSQTTGGRDYSPADVSERTLEEIFLPPFEAAIKAGVGTFMTSFNEIGGIPSTANELLVREKLKDEWNFDGFVVSDYNSVSMLYDTQFVAENLKEAAELAMNAGVDMEMVSRAYVDNLKALVKEGKIDEKQIDDACRRVLEAKFRLGLFEDPYGSRDLNVINSEDHKALALQAARESIVLLKNDGILPLTGNESIALIGPLADAPDDQLGGWTNKQPRNNVVTVRDALQSANYSKGCDILKPLDKNEVNRAVSAAKSSDVVVLVIGETANMSSEPNSRSSLSLPEPQQDLFEAVKATGKPVIVVLMNGRPLTIGEINEKADAVIESWFPGEEGGNAISDVLYGRYNPSAKLTVTFPNTTGQIPLWYYHKPQKNWDHESYGNRYIDIEDDPLYPFGYGLSYTGFDYSELKMEVAEGAVNVSFNIKNTGKMKGSEIAQLYFSDRVASVTVADKKLCSFARVELKPQESRRVEFSIPIERFSLLNSEMKRVVEPGEFEILVGKSSKDIKLRGSFRI